MSVTIINPQQWTPAQVLASTEAGGKKRGRAAGGWIADIAASKKVILLCTSCTHKFNPARVQYRREREFPVAQGKCDGCSTFDLHCAWYVYEGIYTSVRSTAEERRALAKSRESRIKKGQL